MRHKPRMHRLFFHYGLAILVVTGCAPELKHPTPICPGKQSLLQSLDSLKSSSESIISLRATGRCNARFYVEDKKYKESFPVTLWLNPPAQMRLHGDLFLNPRGIVLGSNEHEFWLAVRPKEISTYHWGLWSEQGSSESLMINPKTVLEALGIVAIGGDEGWSLSNEGPFDVLGQRNNRGRITKKVYIYSCSYQVSKIEYFSEDGQIVAVTELFKYKEVSKGCFVPRAIKIVTYAPDGRKDSLEFRLKSVKPYKFDKKKQDIYFRRRKPKGFKHVYRIIDGDIIEQTQ
jgi:hypothetical protein